MTEVDDRCPRERQCRNQGFDVMMAMDDIGRLPQAREIIEHGDSGPPQIGSHFSEDEAERHRPMAATEQGEGNIACVDLRPGTPAERVIR
jgi:hypothetical protein